MLDIIVKVRVLSGAEDEIIGIKEAISNEFERWGWTDVVSIDVTPAEEPQQITLGNITRNKLTKKKIISELKEKNITLEEMRLIINTIVKYSRDFDKQT